MPTAPGGARRVGVALWKGAPTVPRGAGWEREKGQSAHAPSARALQVRWHSLLPELKNDKHTEVPGCAAALYPAPRPLARRPLVRALR